jgi:hypothetical protein
MQTIEMKKALGTIVNNQNHVSFHSFMPQRRARRVSEQTQGEVLTSPLNNLDASHIHVAFKRNIQTPSARPNQDWKYSHQVGVYYY